MMHIGLDKSGQKSDIYHTARQERRKPKGEIQMKNKKYYIAYGSNLSVEQMADRCPDAKIAGQAVLAGWELLFRGCATIAPNPKKNTPVLVWEISERDEENLDLYEGYHHFNRLDIEVYTDYKDPDMEANIEEVLTAHELYYEKSEVWIETEKMYEVLYELTV